jgi:uncharacterized protein YndB with AHSA1/START domain
MSNDTGADQPVVGTLRSVDGTGVVRMEDRYDTGIDDLWSALTEPQRLARWIADVEGDLRVGGEFHANFTSGWEGSGRVDVCEPPRRLRVTMLPGQQHQTVIEAELVAEGDQTSLAVEDGASSPPPTASRPKTSVSTESGDRPEHLIRIANGAILSQNERVPAGRGRRTTSTRPSTVPPRLGDGLAQKSGRSGYLICREPGRGW